MKIMVVAKPKSKHERFEKVDETHFVICVKEPPEGGKANKAIIGALAGHFRIAPSRIELVRGAASRKKVFKILP